jgi:protein-S-isoprenylcysteine O-methyltransferase Ste14
MAGTGFGFWSFVFVQLVVATLLLGIIFLSPGPWDVQRQAGAALAVVSLGFLGVSRYQLGKSFSITPQARALVTHGIYSRIRNPIYVFSALMFAGLILVLHRPMLWLWFVILIPVQTLRARREARVLEERFGDEYRAYRRKTWF